MDVFLEKRGERRTRARELGNETAVEVGKAEESLKLLDRRRLRPVKDGLDLAVVHLHAVGRDDEAEEFAMVAIKLALFSLDEELVLPKSLENLLDLGRVLVRVVREDEDVVEVDDQKVVEQVAEDIVHERLEGCRGVGKAEGHDECLEVTVTCAEGRLPFVALFDADKVVSAPKVELGEDFGAAKSIERFADERQSRAVLDRDLVEAAVVDTKAKGAVLLFDEQDGGAGRGSGRLDEAFGQVFIEPLSECLKFDL